MNNEKKPPESPAQFWTSRAAFGVSVPALLNDDIDQFSRHKHHFTRRFAHQELLYRLAGHGCLAGLLFGHIRRHVDAIAHLAVDLHHQRNRPFGGSGILRSTYSSPK